MRETPVTDHHDTHEHRGISRRDLASSLLIGLCIGIIAGIPVGWFIHRVFFQQRAAQVLLCRQQHYGQPEVELQRICGSVF